MAYLTIAEAVERFGKSESTLRRLIRDVRKNADPAKRRMLRPGEREIEELRNTGTSYTYTLAEELIEQELFGKRPRQGTEQRPDVSSAANIDQLMSKLEERHERELARMEKRLEREQQEKMELLKLAQEDKRLFAKAADSLGQVLRIPAVAHAVAHAQHSTPITVHTPTSTASPSPTAESAKKPSTPKARKTPPTTSRPRNGFRRLFRGLRHSD